MAAHDLTGHALGQYTIMGRLGRGGMADVYKAFHPQLEVYRAIKVIRPELVKADDFRARFQKEAQAVAALRHPNIVQIQDFGDHEGAYYMVMEFVQGEDLKQVVQKSGRIRPVRRAVEIVDQISDALHYAHSQGLIHRDIKPENIMITDEGLPILMDFGIAKLLTENSQLTQTGLSIGTPAYMAPEQAKALPNLGPPADIYSLTVVLYEMLTGRVPFSADTPMAVMLKALSDPLPLPRDFSADISESLQQVLLKGTAKEVNNRYATARQFQEALRRAVDEEPQVEEPVATEVIHTEELPKTIEPSVVTRPSKKGPSIKAAVVAAVVALIGAGGYFVFTAPKPVDTVKTTEPAQSESPVVEPEPAAPKEDKSAEQSVVEQESTEQPQTQQAPPAPQPEPNISEQAAAPDTPVEASPESSTILLEQRMTTTAGEPSEFTLDLERDEVVYLQVHSSSNTTDFSLLAPDGRTEIFKYHNDYGPADIKQTGQHTLGLRTRGDKVSDVDFALWHLQPAVADGGAVQFGKYVTGGTAAPGQVVRYTLDGAAEQTVFFDHTQSSETTDFSLLAPDGRTEVFEYHTDQGPLKLKQTGAYTLLADPRGDKMASFEFAVWNVDPAVIDGGQIEFGRYIQGETTVAGQTVAYGFEGEAGQTLFFDHTSSSDTVDFTLLAPDGRSEVFSYHTDQGPFTIKQAGAYTLTVDPRGDKMASFEFAVWNVDPAVIDGGQIELGRYIQGETTVAGQTVAYGFEREAGQTLFFDHTRSSDTVDFTLLAPDGRSEVFSYHTDQGPMTLEQDGVYTLTADPRGDKTASFEFAIWNVEPPVIDGGQIEFGGYVQGETTVAGQTVSYRFDAESGQTLYFDHTQSSETTDFTLLAPDGRTEVFKYHTDEGPMTLKQEGTYTLTADPRSDKTANFEFILRDKK